MIKSKLEYKEYLQADRVALGVKKSKLGFLKPNPIFEFQKLLRKVEYYKNCKRGFLYKIYYLFIYWKFKKKSIRLGFTIPPNVFGAGLSIAHVGTIVVNANARVGANCRIHVCVNIGASGGEKEAPILGDNVYIGPGAKIYGAITIGNNIAIGANALVNKSFSHRENVVLAGVPAKIVNGIDMDKLIKKGVKNI